MGLRHHWKGLNFWGQGAQGHRARRAPTLGVGGLGGSVPTEPEMGQEPKRDIPSLGIHIPSEKVCSTRLFGSGPAVANLRFAMQNRSAIGDPCFDPEVGTRWERLPNRSLDLLRVHPNLLSPRTASSQCAGPVLHPACLCHRWGHSVGGWVGG